MVVQFLQFQIKKSFMKWIVTTIWMVSLLFGALPLLGWNRYVYEVFLFENFKAIITIGFAVL